MRALPLLAIVVCGAACYEARHSNGGGQISHARAERQPLHAGNPYDIDVPVGYRIELVADKLTYPTGIAFDDANQIYVTESGYAPGEVFGTPRILRIGPNGRTFEMKVEHAADAPWNGIAYADGALIVAQGGERYGGKIVRYPIEGDKLGRPQILVDGLPSVGDHHTNAPIVRDGWVYFGQGTATNSGVVGLDNKDMGWLTRQPAFHDTPCEDVTLTGLNFTTKNVLRGDGEDATTGAFMPYAMPSTPGQVVKGMLPCNGAIMRVRTTGGPIELVAWGFRNPFGLAFDARGNLYATDNGYDTRGSRPVFGAADMLWRVEAGRWYGWPDFSEGRPLTSEWYSEDKGAPKGFVIAKHPSAPPDPAVYFPCHSSADGFDFSRSDAFGHVGEGFVALFGDMAPQAGKVASPVGFAVMRVNPSTGAIEYFARNRGDSPGPASKRDNRGLERPIAARFDHDGAALYIVDFGVLRMTDKGAEAVAQTGKVWRITKEPTDVARR